MKTDEFQDLLLQSAVSIIGCDGDIDDSEIVEIDNLIDNEAYFLGFDKQDKLETLITELKSKGKSAINSYLEHLSTVQLSHRQKLNLLEVVVRATEADGVIHPNEIELLHLIIPKLSLNDEEIITNFPNQISYLLNFQKHELSKEFATEITFNDKTDESKK
ncbi:MAG: tellurite resistance TerB family protein [Ekhidna sp.]|uniref:tellurite resistance TerB family protein n=1 Tax=Ekhidna sp. TaxID=2608089 RepID=UPI0032EC1D25